ncbi:PilZ domain-containing protein [Roseibium sp. CAU 1637]|uniref:PilZ domain-containing protein n=1 Tax=Roseibium limicola TaxID=2816037 RepID=A0A939ERA2_9HYPH|nr:PilZ domain-containing protein [Roseibium limicola]
MSYFSRRKAKIVSTDLTSIEENSISSQEVSVDHRATASQNDVAPSSAHTLDAIEDDLQVAAKSMSEAAGEVTSKINSQRHLLGQVEDASDRLETQSSEAASTASELAHSISELSSASDEIGRQITNSNQLVDQARGLADEANQGVLELQSAIDAIANVVRLISDVAKQTNLLALNATIEAARAGEAGKGFAVVASEVKALSQQTQNATDEISSNIARLQDSAGTSIGNVTRVIDVIAEIRPSFATVEAAVHEQIDTTRSIGDRARDTAQFVQEVSSQAQAIAASTEQAMKVADEAAQASTGMGERADGLGNRFTMMIRQTALGDRRQQDRWPARLNGTLRAPQGTQRFETLDISEGGLLLKPEGDPSSSTGSLLDLQVTGLGSTQVRVVAVSENGLHCSFVSPGTEFISAVRQKIAQIHSEHEVFVERAQDGANRIAAAMDELIRTGQLQADDLFDTSYEPIEGSAPQQFATRYLKHLEKLLPTIQEGILGTDKSMAFCAAVDRNGYLPVHNKIYSHPQKADDPVWNAGNCRNKRIFDDRAGLSAGRNTRPFLIQTYARDMGAGNIIWMREIDAPILIQGRHWGGFRTAYKM